MAKRDSMLDGLRVESGRPADLAGRNPAARLGLGDKTSGQARTEELLEHPRRAPQPTVGRSAT